jgi:molecular chaperone GrpE
LSGVFYVKNPFKKIFSMQENETTAPEQPQETPVSSNEETMNTTAASAENAQETAENIHIIDPVIVDLRKQLEEAKTKYIYLLSDFENYKRNASKERIEMMQTAGRDIMSGLLPILDDFDRAVKNGAVSEGMQLIHNKLVHNLKTKGLSVMPLQPGDDFNADQQEAVAEIPAASDELKGKIVDILEPGYQLGERMIRYAKVVVGR